MSRCEHGLRHGECHPCSEAGSVDTTLFINEQLRHENAALREKLAACEKDAERYRWLLPEVGALKTRVSEILDASIGGRDERYRFDGGYIRWGLVEKDIHAAIEGHDMNSVRKDG